MPNFDHHYKNKAGLANLFHLCLYGRTSLPQYKNLNHI